MTLTFNYDKYKELLTNYLPKVIKTEAENEQALAKVEALMNRKRTPEENEVYRLLITLIEKFESEHYRPNQPSNPASMLLFLLEDSGKSKDDLIAVLGSENILDCLCNGEKITVEQARQLGDFFQVEPSLFLE
ncbi:MAG: transcriptional regulator [Oscillatoria sp. PMC 1068.18]|nr:transcriptional regulator [Oscillatoria sp. PMC 1076.18]MEC4987474.1 transcriptional regulator [Oscillatoria sp. PMC 1068.18]